MVAEKKFRIAEIFGPTIQGEGRHIGIPTYFIRFGGCDFRCSWCDSPHAVLPDLVAQLPQMTENEIVAKLLTLAKGPNWIVYSGGNPALLDLKLLTAILQDGGWQIMVETQGTIWNDWLAHVDEICISPKPPSSGNITTFMNLREFMDLSLHPLERYRSHPWYFKVVVFNDGDYQYAKDVHLAYPDIEMFLSVGNDDPSLPTVGNPKPLHAPKEQTQATVLNSMRWLMEKTARDRVMRDVRVLPQMHVLAWGNERGR